MRAIVTGGRLTVDRVTYSAPRLPLFEGQELAVSPGVYTRTATTPDGERLVVYADKASLRARVAELAPQWNREQGGRRRIGGFRPPAKR